MSRYVPGVVLGVLLASTAAVSAADYAPLDCGKAKSGTEKAICKSYALGQDEARMATLYAIATSLVGMGRRGDIEDAQRAFLQKREACGARIPCLKDAYAVRIGELDSVVESVVSRGPF
jgi:uncharacterized protein